MPRPSNMDETQRWHYDEGLYDATIQYKDRLFETQRQSDARYDDILDFAYVLYCDIVTKRRMVVTNPMHNQMILSGLKPTYKRLGVHYFIDALLKHHGMGVVRQETVDELEEDSEFIDDDDYWDQYPSDPFPTP